MWRSFARLFVMHFETAYGIQCEPLDLSMPKKSTATSEDSQFRRESSFASVMWSEDELSKLSHQQISKYKCMSRRTNYKNTYLCEVCKKVYDRPSYLKRHLLSHTGNLFIPQSFNSYDWAKFKMYFYDNIITIYFLLPKHYNNGTGEKPHVCTVCHKKFSTTSSLNTHQRIHSGEKPHKCFICGKCFTASSNLYYHKMIHFTVRLLIDTYVWIIMKYAYQYCLHISACLFISSDYFRNYFDFRRNHINVATVRNHFQHQEICGPISTSIRVIGPSIARYAREDLLNRQIMSHTNTQSQWY